MLLGFVYENPMFEIQVTFYWMVAVAEEPVAEDASMGLMDLMGFPSGQIKELLSIECWPSLGTTSTFFESCAAESVVSAEARGITSLSKDANRLAGLTQNIEGGISIFQR